MSEEYKGIASAIIRFCNADNDHDSMTAFIVSKIQDAVLQANAALTAEVAKTKTELADEREVSERLQTECNAAVDEAAAVLRQAVWLQKERIRFEKDAVAEPSRLRAEVARLQDERNQLAIQFCEAAKERDESALRLARTGEQVREAVRASIISQLQTATLDTPASALARDNIVQEVIGIIRALDLSAITGQSDSGIVEAINQLADEIEANESELKLCTLTDHMQDACQCRNLAKLLRGLAAPQKGDERDGSNDKTGTV